MRHEVNLTERDFINLTARYGTREGGQNSFLNYNEWSSNSNDVLYYNNITDRTREGIYGERTLHTFIILKVKGTKLKMKLISDTMKVMNQR